jgi:hypothetical protein
VNLEEPNGAIRRVIWILKGLNKHEKAGREKLNLLSKIDRLEEERRKKSIVIFGLEGTRNKTVAVVTEFLKQTAEIQTLASKIDNVKEKGEK